MTLHELIDLTREYTNDAVNIKIFDTTLVRFLNAGIRDFCVNTKFFKTKIEQKSVAEQSDYDLKDAAGTEIFEVDNVLYDKIKLDAWTPDKLFETTEFQETTAGIPLIYTSFNPLSIILYPIPDETDKDIDIYGSGMPATNSYFKYVTLTGVSPLGAEWDMALVYFAATQMELSAGNRLQAGEFKTEYNKHILMAIRASKRRIHYRYSFFPKT